MSEKVKDRDYLFTAALVRAREASMLTEEKRSRMLEAENFAESARILAECGYPDLSEADAAGVNAALGEASAALFAELRTLVPEPELVEAFQIKYDIHNVKTLLKAQAAGVEGAYLLSAAGSVDKEQLTESFLADGGHSLSGWLGEAMEEASGILARTGNPQLADIALDKRYFARLLYCGEAVVGDFLTRYVRLLIDNANLRTLVRTLRMGRDAQFLEGALIPGGNIDCARLLEASASAGEGVAAAFEGTQLAQAAALGAEGLSGGAMTAFERACDNAMTAFLEEAKLISTGPAPVAAFLAAKENEMTAARMILTGILSGIDRTAIRERLRDSYA